MKTSTLKILDKYLNDPRYVAGPASEEEVADAERDLQRKFSPDHREFMLRYGGAVVGNLEVLGVRVAPGMWKGSLVVPMTKRHLAEGNAPPDTVVVAEDLDGSAVYQTPDGEVCVLDHDFGGTYRVRPSFEDFLLMLVEHGQLDYPN